MRLIHITDPHLSSLESDRFTRLRGKRRSGYLSWLRKRRFVHRSRVLERLTLALQGERPDLVALTGDLVHIGLEHEIEQAAAWLKRLGPPERVMLIPGNHDLYADDSLAAVRRHWASYLPPVASGDEIHSGYPVNREQGNVRLTGLNSSVPTIVFSATGECGERQLSALPGFLDDRFFNVVLVHHPPLPGLCSRRKALRDDRRLQECFDERCPDLVLYGHIHVNRSGAYRDARIFCTASASSALDASYRIFDITGGDGNWQVHMQLKILDAENGGSFVVREETDWSVNH